MKFYSRSIQGFILVPESAFDWDSLMCLPEMDKLGPFLSETESVPSPHGSPQSDEHFGLFPNIPPIAQPPSVFIWYNLIILKSF